MIDLTLWLSNASFRNHTFLRSITRNLLKGMVTKAINAVARKVKESPKESVTRPKIIGDNAPKLCVMA